MLKLIKWLFSGDSHSHKWKIIKETTIFVDEDDELPVGTKYTLQCEVCGNIKYKVNY